ncbi:MAG: MFS transporter [Thermofilum sp.]|uniref:MFS transporter n=1 Tax=Thermofilum TaxID=2268 RepID=UPI00164F18FE|nr:MFS transporter [Thermofilum adornatum]
MKFIHARKPAIILLFYIVLTSFGASLFRPFFSLYFIRLGGTPFMLGILGSLSSFIILCLNFFGGYFTDKYGNWLVLGVLLIVTHFFVALYAVAWDWRVLFLFVLLATVFSFYGPARDSLMASVFKEKERAIGYQLMEVARRIVKLVSPLIAGVLISIFGILVGVRIGMVIAGTFGIISGVLILLFMREERKVSQNAKLDRTSAQFFGAYLNLIRSIDRRIILLILLGSIIIFVFAMASPFLVIYSTEIAKVSELEYGLILTVSNICITFFVLPLSGFIIRMLGEINCIIISSFVITLSMMLFLLQPNLMVLLVAYVLLETSVNFYEPSLFSFWTRSIRDIDRGKFSSIVSLIEGATIIAPLLGGELYSISPVFLFIAGAILGVIAFASLCIFKFACQVK